MSYSKCSPGDIDGNTETSSLLLTKNIRKLSILVLTKNLIYSFLHDDFFFVVWLTDERCLALFSAAGTIARGPHHLQSPIRLSSGFVELSCAVVITTTSRCQTTTPRRHYLYLLLLFFSVTSLFVL